MNRTNAPRQAAEKVREILDVDLGRTRDAAAHGAEQAWQRLAPHLESLAAEAGHAVGRARSTAVAASHEVPGRSAAALAALRGRAGAAEIEQLRKRRSRRRIGFIAALAALAAAGVLVRAWGREQRRYEELSEDVPHQALSDEDSPGGDLSLPDGPEDLVADTEARNLHDLGSGRPAAGH
ncbi:DUF5324 family protein [Kitasatospora sp. NPDC057223]|uniref:DUF5324 family protein n=1 Tax=Kitasatospora sp. NPDC057223 TaxID=3346055 RepID=UPI00362F2E74